MNWAPRFVGVRDGEEVLSWLSGATLDDWRLEPERLDRLAIIIRELHDLTADMVRGAECLVHDDLQPRNIVVDEVGGIGLIDWEQLRPGRRVEDVAQVCWSFVGPISGDQVGEVARRWRRVLDAYELEDRGEVVTTAITKVARCIDDITRQAKLGSTRHQTLKDRGDHRDLRALYEWLDANHQHLATAIN